MKILLSFVTVVAMATLPAAAACAGADPSLGTVSAGHVSTAAELSTYRLTGTVTNAGDMAQASDVLQSVDVFQDGQKVDSIGIPPLHAHQSYTFTYAAKRSSDAGAGTTKMLFRLRMSRPVGTGPQDCNAGNDSSTMTF
jgi:hypothetical protein